MHREISSNNFLNYDVLMKYTEKYNLDVEKVEVDSIGHEILFQYFVQNTQQSAPDILYKIYGVSDEDAKKFQKIFQKTNSKSHIDAVMPFLAVPE
jgi:hypothetical protein